jgi:hypothetical protein
VGKCVSYLRAHVLFEVAGLKRQVREVKKSVEELMSTSIVQDQQQVIRLLEGKVSEQDAQVVSSRAFFLFSPCNHIINIKKKFFFRRSKRQRNF